MTLVSSLIVDAFRESNMLPLGGVQSTNQSAEALRLYNTLVTSVFGGLAGEHLNDWPLGILNRDPTDWCYPLPYTDIQLVHPVPNSRLIAANLAPLTVHLPVNPQDGSRMGISDPFGQLAAQPVTLDGNGRTIEGTPTLLLNTNGTNREWIYRSDTSAWVKISPLALTDDNPFPAAFDTMFIIMLAMRLNPRYGRQLDEQSVAMLKQNKREFVARYLQSAPLEINDSLSWPFMSRQTGTMGGGFSSTQAFNRGRYGG